MDFPDIERTIVDYLDQSGLMVEEREAEWVLIVGETRISLTGLAAALHQTSLHQCGCGK